MPINLTSNEWYGECMLNEVEEIELDITEAEEFAAQGKALLRLYNNKDFKTLIIDGYFKEHACHLIELKASPAMRSVDSQADIIKSIDSIGNLQQFFNAIDQRGLHAEMAISAGNEALDEMSGGPH